MITALLVTFTFPIVWILIAIWVRRRDARKGFNSLLLLLLFLMYFKFVHMEQSYYEPQTHNFTIDKLLSKHDNDFDFYRLELDDEKFTLVTIKLKDYEILMRLAAFRSSSPVYVFNIDGVYLDWSNNLDDDQDFADYWNLNFRQQLSIDEIMRK